MRLQRQVGQLQARIRVENPFVAEIMVADVSDSAARPGNDADIHRIERMALLYSIGVRLPFKVRPLRKSFLRALNQYATGDQEPFSLCIMEGYWELGTQVHARSASRDPSGLVGKDGRWHDS